MRYNHCGPNRYLPKTLGLAACLLLSGLFLGNTSAMTQQSGLAGAVSGANDQYLVEFSGNTLPKDLRARIAGLGGRIVNSFPEIGVALVAGLRPASAASLASQTDVRSVTLDES